MAQDVENKYKSFEQAKKRKLELEQNDDFVQKNVIDQHNDSKEINMTNSESSNKVFSIKDYFKSVGF